MFSDISVNNDDEDSGGKNPGYGGAAGDGNRYANGVPILAGGDGRVVIINITTNEKIISSYTNWSLEQSPLFLESQLLLWCELCLTTLRYLRKAAPLLLGDCILYCIDYLF